MAGFHQASSGPSVGVAQVVHPNEHLLALQLAHRTLPLDRRPGSRVQFHSPLLPGLRALVLRPGPRHLHRCCAGAQVDVCLPQGYLLARPQSREEREFVEVDAARVPDLRQH